ncbi:MAG TPA: S53 family peptidase [Gaiellaceae bacterium]|nr:S53 family peptidase [Gaiellaceae bacterium]
MKRKLLVAAALTLVLVGVSMLAGALTRSEDAQIAYPVPHPTVSDFQFIKSTTPTEADCEAVLRTCFTPQALQSAYNVGPLYQQGYTGKGMTIAIVDSYGSDTMAHDLHVFNQAFGLQPMCGEEGVTCTAGMPTFSELALNGSPETKAQPGKGTHLEDKSAWALEVALDVETSHAMAPGANILLVHSNNAETLGVQGFPNMMKAEDYVVKNHLANVISQSFASAEDAFGSFQSLENLRDAFKNAAANGVTVLGSSGDGGTANLRKAPVGQGFSLIPFPTVEWPASDPLVTGVGGTYLCTNPTASTNDPRTTSIKPGIGAKCGSSTFNAAHAGEVAWTFSGGGFSHVFTRPAYQGGTLPAGSTPIPASSRGVPDIGLQASAGTGALVYLSLPPDGNGSNINQTGWYDIGGTSLSCPQWAGLIAIADQINKAKYGQTGLGLINPALYKVASNPASYTTDFFDVAHTAVAGVENNNQGDPSVPGYPATQGWDPVTGLGTPNAAVLLPDLVDAAHS